MGVGNTYVLALTVFDDAAGPRCTRAATSRPRVVLRQTRQAEDTGSILVPRWGPDRLVHCCECLMTAPPAVVKSPLAYSAGPLPSSNTVKAKT